MLFFYYLFLNLAHPASYPKGKGALTPGLKRPGREADQSHGILQQHCTASQPRRPL